MPGTRKSAEAKFRARVAELGGTIVEPFVWRGVLERYRVTCAAGHEWSPLAQSVNSAGGRLCLVCGGNDPAISEAKFRARVAELGGTIVEPLVWRGVRERYRVVCAAGHECSPLAHSVNKGRGLCPACIRDDSATAEAKFRARVAELGGTIVEPLVWRGVSERYRIICAAGHESTPRPHGTLTGVGICRACSGTDPVTAEANFRARVVELGGTIVEPFTWRGVTEHYRVICAAGHECSPLAMSVNKGRGLCRICGGRDSATAEANFRARVAELGGTLLEPFYLGANVPHRVRCDSGHVTTPCPASVARGYGICRVCAGMVWDRFYVVINSDRARLKFGITSAESGRRLAIHRYNGYRTVIRFLSVADADSLERNTLLTLKLANVNPVHGKEYFDLSALPLVLDVADNWPGAAVVQP